MAFEKVRKALEARGFAVTAFRTKEEAAAYLDGAIDGVSVGLGGSVTLQEMGLYELLSAHDEVHWHWKGGTGERRPAIAGDVYLCSVNALAETGEIVQIDGTGNRAAAMLFGPRRVYLVVGRNKIVPTYEDALWRARNVAAPKNAQRLGVRTPCAAKGERCYDCRSPERICRGLVVLWGPTMESRTEVVLIDEDLGM